MPNSCAEFITTAVGRLFKKQIASIGQHFPHGLTQHRQRKIKMSMVGLVPWVFCRKSGWCGKTVGLSENDDVAAAFPGFHVAFFAKQFVGVFNGNGADPSLFGETALGGELGIAGVDALDNVVPYRFVETKIGGAFFLLRDIVHLVI